MYKKYKKIDFIKYLNVSDIYSPYPTKKKIPDWYKKTGLDDYKKNILDKENSRTIKNCIPILDSLTSGYIITTFCDIYIFQETINNPNNKEKKDIILPETPNKNAIKAIEFHEKYQANNHPLFNNKKIPKFMNAWGIKTPPGYSCLFINPMNNSSKDFSIIEGIVDTDGYNAPVNFPFIFNDSNFNGLIPAGTPIAQIIPFKRDSWNMEIENNNLKARNTILSIDSLFINKYKKIFWSKKEYN